MLQLILACMLVKLPQRKASIAERAQQVRITGMETDLTGAMFCLATVQLCPLNIPQVLEKAI